MYEHRQNLGEVYRRLAYELDRFWEANDIAIQPLCTWFKRAAVALAVEVVLLLAVVSDNLW